MVSMTMRILFPRRPDGLDRIRDIRLGHPNGACPLAGLAQHPRELGKAWDLDRLEQDVVRITHKDTPETLVLKGKDLEKIVLSRAVKKHIERKILTYHNKTIIFS